MKKKLPPNFYYKPPTSSEGWQKKLIYCTYKIQIWKLVNFLAMFLCLLEILPLFLSLFPNLSFEMQTCKIKVTLLPVNSIKRSIACWQKRAEQKINLYYKWMTYTLILAYQNILLKKTSCLNVITIKNITGSYISLSIINNRISDEK